jgi:chloramphenicol O-acetyltransferase type A
VGHYIDLDTWPRRAHYGLFRDYDRPHFSIAADVDVSRLYAASREPDGPSFVLGVLFSALRAVNAVEAFRLRIRGEQVWRHEQAGIGCTVARPDRSFGFGYFPWQPDFSAFAQHGRAEIDRAKAGGELLDPRADDDYWTHSTFLPWIRFTSFTNANRREMSVPKLAFGQRHERDGAWLMPVAVEVHHALVDGIDVGEFFQSFQTFLNAPLAGVPGVS